MPSFVTAMGKSSTPAGASEEGGACGFTPAGASVEGGACGFTPAPFPLPGAPAHTLGSFAGSGELEAAFEVVIGLPEAPAFATDVGWVLGDELESVLEGDGGCDLVGDFEAAADVEAPAVLPARTASVDALLCGFELPVAALLGAPPPPVWGGASFDFLVVGWAAPAFTDAFPGDVLATARLCRPRTLA